MNRALLKTTVKTLFLVSLMVVSLVFLAACGGGGSDGLGGTGITPIAKGKLSRSDETKLSAYFQESIKNNHDKALDAPVATNDSASEDGGAGGSGTGSIVTSSTNVQETGVDEADLIKTNGRYIYSVEKRSSHDVFIDTGGIVSEGDSIGLPHENTPEKSDVIRIMDTQGSSGLVEINRFKSDEQANEEPWRIAGIYLHETKKRLVALASPKRNYYTKWFDSQYFSNQETKVLFIDVNDPENAQRESTLQFEGQLISSRRKGDTLYMILRHYPDYQFVDNERLSTTTTKDFLPTYRVDNDPARLISKPQDCYVEVGKVGQRASADIITLVAVDLKSDTHTVNSQCYVGSAEALYASQNALYLATTRWDYHANNGVAAYNSKVTTDIHKFNYDGLDFDYRGSGEVDGHLGYKQDSKSFRFSESQGLLRVVTFDEDQWGTIGLPEVQPADLVAEGPQTGGGSGATDSAPVEDATSPPFRAKSPVLLSILEESPSKKALQLVSKLPNAERPEPIGLPGERLYATRYIGNRAYVVTFRVTDPLYVLDLSNPADPFIAGELKVNGYSDYLHPVSENLLLGIGKDAIPAGNNGSNGGDGRGAWYQGVKLSLIDVSDPSNPREADKIIIGKRGTETAVLSDHHALTSVQIGDEYRVAIPVRLHEGTPNHSSGNPASDYYSYSKTGLYRFEIDIDNQQINKLPAMVVADASDRPSRQVSINNDRSVIIDDTVYYMHDGKFWVQDWQGENDLVGPE